MCSPRSRLARARQLVEDRCGLSEDHRAGDAKLVLMYVAIVAGCVAQFWPTPFPANRPLLAVCVAASAPAAATPMRAALSTLSAAPPLRAPLGPRSCVTIYFALSALYQYYVWFVEKDTIYTSRRAAAGAPTLTLRTRLRKFDDEYAVDAESPRGTPVAGASARASVGKFFTKKGDFSQAHFAAWVRRALLPALAPLAAAAQGSKKAQ